jgi:hypothetical protein
MSKYAPWMPIYVGNQRRFVSSRVKNWVYSSYLGNPYYNALAVN